MPVKDVQTTNRQHPVPQNIMDVEFKIIGELTMRQFFYLLIFCGLAYGVFQFVNSPIFKWPLILLFVLTGVALAFVPLQERSLDEWVVNFFKAIYAPNQKIWRKETTIPSAFMYENINVVKQELITLAPTSSRRKLEEYLEYQGSEKNKDELDIPVEDFVNKVHNAFLNKPQTTTLPQNLTQSTITSQQLPQVPIQQNKSTKDKNIIENNKTKDVNNQQQQKVVTTQQLPKTTIAQQNQDNDVKYKQETIKKPTVQQTSNTDLDDRKLNTITHKSNSTPTEPLTPDRHSGRRLANLFPDQGEIILPTRNEVKLQSAEEKNIEFEVAEKAKQLKMLIDQIKKDELYKNITVKTTTDNKDLFDAPMPKIDKENTNTATPQELEIKNEEQAQQILNTDAKNVIEQIKQENLKLTKEIERLKQEVQNNKAPEKEQELQKLQKEKEKAVSDYSMLRQKVSELQNKLRRNQKELPKVIVQKVYEDKPAEPLPGTIEPKFANINMLTDSPNIISGVVKANDGSVISDAIIIIKNKKNEPARALKTNSLGQFVITTALAPGMYAVEVDPANKTGLKFDIVSIEANGKIIRPLEFIGKKE